MSVDVGSLFELEITVLWGFYLKTYAVYKTYLIEDWLKNL